jgi:uncharacterized membrane protein
MARTRRQRRKLGKERLNALTEGVYAVVMTLMLLSVIDDIAEPGIDISHLPEIIRDLWPKFVAFFISFFVAGSLWIGDNVLLDDITHVDVRFLYLKLGNLLAVTLLGFSATLLGEHRESWLVEVIYGLNMIAMYLGTWLSVRYALHNGLMERRPDNVNLLDSIRRRVLIAVFGLTVATLLSFWNPLYSFRLFMLLAVSFSISSLLFSYEWATINEEGN